MISISLDQAYTCVSANKEKIAVCGKSGVSLIGQNKELCKLSSFESHQIRYSKEGLLGVCRGKILEVYENLNKVWSTEQHTKKIRDIDWNAENLIASCSNESKLVVWDIRTSAPVIKFNPTKGLGIYCLAWAKHSNEFLASGHETALKLWDRRFPKKSVCTIRSAHSGRIIDLDWQEKSSNLLSCSQDSCIKTWKTSSTNMIMTNNVTTHFQIIKTLYSPDSHRIVYISENLDNNIHFLNSDDLKSPAGFDVEAFVKDISWHDSSLVALCADGLIKVVNFDSHEDENKEEDIRDEFSESDVLDCSINILNFEEELKYIQENPINGIHIEDVGYTQRYCLIRIRNDREYLSYMLTFPKEYPYSPPNFSLQSYSNNLSLIAPEQLKQLEVEVVKKSKQFCKLKIFTIQKICDFLLDQLNQITKTEDYEDFNDFLESKMDYSSYSKNKPISCIHVWDPSGSLLIFTVAENPNQDAELDDYSDLENSHYQAGIQ